MTIHVKVPCRLWHLQHNTLHIFRHCNLASETTRFGQPKGHVEHIFLLVVVASEYQICLPSAVHDDPSSAYLVFRWLWQRIVHVERQN